MRHLFLDLEGAGKVAGSAILQIGAVVFDLSRGGDADPIEFEIISEFHVHVKAQAPFTADFATLEWHKEKGTWPVGPGIFEMPPQTALQVFRDWLALPGHADSVTDVWVWGMDYDLPLFDRAEMIAGPGATPWAYWQPADARTIWKLAFRGQKHEPRPHHALEDCRAGIADLVAALNRLSCNPADV